MDIPVGMLSKKILICRIIPRILVRDYAVFPNAREKMFTPGL